MARIFGSHTIDTGGMDMALRRAVNAGFDTVQIFTAIPKFYGDKSGIREERIDRFEEALEETGVDPAHVLVHAAYVLNLATTDESRWARGRDGIARELERSGMLGVGGVCFHPGSAGRGDVSAGIDRIVRAMTEALDAVDNDVRLYVENTAGGGRTIGRDASEVGRIMAGLPERHAHRVGYGLDTCHLFASGYDLRDGPDAVRSVLDEFEAETGVRPAFFHLNDSEGELGSNRDRHRLLGEGEIGVEPFEWLLADERTIGVPLVVETPQERPEVERDDATPDPADVRMAELLHRMVPEA